MDIDIDMQYIYIPEDKDIPDDNCLFLDGTIMVSFNIFHLFSFLIYLDELII